MTNETSHATSSEAWPPSNSDFDLFYSGVRERRLLVQQCTHCNTPRFPPGPGCASCGSLQWRALECSGRGVVYSYTIHHRPPIPPFPTPHAIALVELAEGVRMAAAFTGPDIYINLPVMVEFVGAADVIRPQFRAATAA